MDKWYLLAFFAGLAVDLWTGNVMGSTSVILMVTVFAYELIRRFI